MRRNHEQSDHEVSPKGSWAMSVMHAAHPQGAVLPSQPDGAPPVDGSLAGRERLAGIGHDQVPPDVHSPGQPSQPVLDDVPVDERCAICHEGFPTPNTGDGKAEMITPDDMRDIESGLIGEDQEVMTYVVHYACGMAQGYHLA
jgi:hypothetical protein